MKATYWFIMSAVGALSGCGELMFGSVDEYALGSSSCRDMAPSCGPSGDEDCCVSPVVEGKTANEADNTFPLAMVSDFRLERFEVTVGRFRAFVQAYPESKPAAGYGAHPRIQASGWMSAWDSILPVDQSALKERLRCNASFQTWTDTFGANESLPINCIDWYVAFAFCAWDGGRLPTEAEWKYAAAGGDQDRLFPWSEPPTDDFIDPTIASYDCLADGSNRWDCSSADLLAVGMKSPQGDGAFGQADMAGSLREWTLDGYRDLPMTMCHDCAHLPDEPSSRVLRGGAWDLAATTLMNSSRHQASPGFRFHDVGFRCAREVDGR